MRTIVLVSLGCLATAGGAAVAVPQANLDVQLSPVSTPDSAEGISSSTMKALVSDATRKAQEEQSAAHSKEINEVNERSEQELSRVRAEHAAKLRMDEHRLASVTKALDDLRALLSEEPPSFAKKMKDLENLNLRRSKDKVAELTAQLQKAERDVAAYKKQADDNLAIGKKQHVQFEQYLSEQNSGFKEIKRKAAQMVAGMLTAAKDREKALEAQASKSKKDIKNLSRGITQVSAKVANIKAELASTLAATAQLKDDVRSVRMQRDGNRRQTRVDALRSQVDAKKQELQELDQFAAREKGV